MELPQYRIYRIFKNIRKYDILVMDSMPIMFSMKKCRNSLISVILQKTDSGKKFEINGDSKEKELS
jgi:hypothetical protein